MRLAKDIYWSYLQDFGALGIGNILIPVGNVFVDIEYVPSAHIVEQFGYSKEEFLNMIYILWILKY